MKRIFIVLFIIQSLAVNAQTRRIESNIKKLDNAQFYIDHSKKASFVYKSSAANKLIRIGKPAIEKLIETLSDSSKTIMAHLILCHIYFNKVSFAGPKEQTRNGETVYKYYLGEEKGRGLLISETKKAKTYNMYIETKDKDDIISYWKTKVKA